MTEASLIERVAIAAAILVASGCCFALAVACFVVSLDLGWWGPLATSPWWIGLIVIPGGLLKDAVGDGFQ